CSFPPVFALSPTACMLCGRVAADPEVCGRKIEQEYYCPGAPGGSVGCIPAAATSCALPGGVGLDGEALRLPLTGLLCSFQRCFVCGKNGAAITCCREGCDRSFHLPCAIDGECITQYFPPHRSFCREHRPEQQVEALPEENTNCLICLEPVGDRKSFQTLVCPACKHAWFHRGCVQVGAIPLPPGHSRNNHDFNFDMLVMGIRVPVRLVSCQLTAQEAASSVPCPALPLQSCLSAVPPWELLLCISCTAEGTHRRCSNVSTNTIIWECESCAGQGNGKRQSTSMPLGWGQGPDKAWQQVPRLGLAEPLCPKRARVTALASPLWPLCP
uniref:Zinc finger PHD-type domain-containing protein n=1 Tax=Athene cunicularia TaxID=194338 RepID=A0A663N302_ATHCN